MNRTGYGLLYYRSNLLPHYALIYIIIGAKKEGYHV
jgi:hypothetical protein